MSSKKHESTVAELNKPYEPNEIGIRGIIYFAVGLFLLIVVTFVLMWMLQYVVLHDTFADEKKSSNPMAMSDKEQLPPEPRLQGAPGFGVDSPTGRVNMELGAPQAEYLELRKEWDDIIEHGQKHPVTGTVISIPVEEAKTIYLALKKKAKSGADVEKLAAESRKYISDASSGRVASASRR